MLIAYRKPRRETTGAIYVLHSIHFSILNIYGSSGGTRFGQLAPPTTEIRFMKARSQLWIDGPFL
jgi:hypothetical protein